jgi:hypothetical protein
MTREDQMLYTLQHARSGELLRELSASLTECKRAAADSGKPATLTLALTITAKGRQFLITDKVATKVPRAEQDVTIMFEDDHGNFTRRDPNQRELELRSADEAPGALREAG